MTQTALAFDAPPALATQTEGDVMRCIICRDREASRKKRCERCYRYKLYAGVDRPPNLGNDLRGRRRTLEERFWPKVRRGTATECWVWTAARTTYGYGKIGKAVGSPSDAHRVSWEIHNGPIPAGLCVLHRCDNPPCVNPEHLFLGTVADNNRDMCAKGRRRGGGLFGEKNGWARLTRDKVIAIRARWPQTSQRKLAAELGVSPNTVGLVVRRETWGHIQ